jgi:hypothetical protein
VAIGTVIPDSTVQSAEIMTILNLKKGYSAHIKFEIIGLNKGTVIVFF